jgi:hypothetical protein
MMGWLVFTSAFLGLVGNKVLQRLSVFSFILALIFVLLEALGLIDNSGPLEEFANEVVSNYLGIPTNELEKFEGVKDGKRK